MTDPTETLVQEIVLAMSSCDADPDISIMSWQVRLTEARAILPIIQRREIEAALAERQRIVAWLGDCRAVHEANAKCKGQQTARKHHIDACNYIADAIQEWDRLK